MEQKEKIILSLYEIGAIKFGNYNLKSGINSPFYIDLRLIISYPQLLKDISELMYKKIRNLTYDNICGVPYTALPIATSISINHNIKMIMKRKEKKNYGTKKLIEGVYKKGDKCIIIEDLITTGSSILETSEELKKEGLIIKDTIVLIDRQYQNNFKKYNIKLHSIFTIIEIVDFLYRNDKISLQIYNSIIYFIKKNQKITYNNRKKFTNNDTLKKLYTIMEEKKTNLCLSVDLTKSQSILKLIEKCGKHICIVKTHIDIIEDFTWDFILKLTELSLKYNF